jgi:hypothetical protein
MALAVFVANSGPLLAPEFASQRLSTIDVGMGASAVPEVADQIC